VKTQPTSVLNAVTRAFGDAEIAHNYENFFSYVLRRNQFEVMNVLSGLWVASGTTTTMDSTKAAVQGVCSRMNIYTADIYGQFQALGYNYLLANYYTYDAVHHNEIAHTHAARIMLDSIIAAIHQAPGVTSKAAASPSPASAGAAVTFSVGVSDANSDALSYDWSFSDGGSATGNPATHAFATAGTYTATVTIDDKRGGTAVSSVEVIVTPATNGGDGSGAMADSDSDGVSDANELADGTDPQSAASFKKVPMTLVKLQGSVKFSSQGRDGCALSGILPAIPAGFDPTLAAFAVNVAGAKVSFALDARGRSSNSNGAVALKLKPSVRNKATRKVEFLGGDVSFTLKLKNGAWAALWADDGIVDTTLKDAPASITVDVTFAGRVYTATAATKYSAKACSGGKFKK